MDCYSGTTILERKGSCEDVKCISSAMREILCFTSNTNKIGILEVFFMLHCAVVERCFLELCYHSKKVRATGLWCSLIEMTNSHYGRNGVEIPISSVVKFRFFCYLFSIEYKHEVSHVYAILQYEAEHANKLATFNDLREDQYETHNLFVLDSHVSEIEIDSLNKISLPHNMCVKEKRSRGFFTCRE